MVERSRQTSEGPWDLRNNTAMSFLVFLFALYTLDWVLEKPAL